MNVMCIFSFDKTAFAVHLQLHSTRPRSQQARNDNLCATLVGTTPTGNSMHRGSHKAANIKFPGEVINFLVTHHTCEDKAMLVQTFKVRMGDAIAFSFSVASNIPVVALPPFDQPSRGLPVVLAVGVLLVGAGKLSVRVIKRPR